MSWNFPAVFLLLIPLSGFIAWAGDRIGHRIGKRRHTFLGLRPRHTATITTVAAGMLISLVSFGLMWVSNATFRNVLRNGVALYQYNKQLRGRNEELRRDVAAQRSLAGEMRTEAEKARQEAEAALFAKGLALKDQQVAKADLREAEATLARAAEDLSAARHDLSIKKGQLRDKEARVAEASEKVRAAGESLRRAQTATIEAKRRVANATRDFNAVTTRLQEVSTRHKAQAAEQQAQSDLQKVELARLAEELEARRAELETLEAKRAELDAQLGQSLTRTTSLRRNKITYQVGEEIARASLPAEMTTVDAQMTLWRLLTEAADKAAARGAAARAQGRAAVILPKPVRVADNAEDPAASAQETPGEGKILDEADLVAAAADAIRRAEEDVAVLVLASANAVEGEPVPVEFRTYRNRRVLRRNAVLGVITLDGTRPQPAIADSLYTFLRRDIRKRLHSVGVIPPAQDGAPGASDDTIVSISGDRWFRVLEEVRRAGPAAQVVVRAATDLRAADPPSLLFEVHPARDVSSAGR